MGSKLSPLDQREASAVWEKCLQSANPSRVPLWKALMCLPHITKAAGMSKPSLDKLAAHAKGLKEVASSGSISQEQFYELVAYALNCSPKKQKNPWDALSRSAQLYVGAGGLLVLMAVLSALPAVLAMSKPYLMLLPPLVLGPVIGILVILALDTRQQEALQRQNSSALQRQLTRQATSGLDKSSGSLIKVGAIRAGDAIDDEEMEGEDVGPSVAEARANKVRELLQGPDDAASVQDITALYQLLVGDELKNQLDAGVPARKVLAESTTEETVVETRLGPLELVVTQPKVEMTPRDGTVVLGASTLLVSEACRQSLQIDRNNSASSSRSGSSSGGNGSTPTAAGAKAKKGGPVKKQALSGIPDYSDDDDDDDDLDGEELTLDEPYAPTFPHVRPAPIAVPAAAPAPAAGASDPHAVSPSGGSMSVKAGLKSLGKLLKPGKDKSDGGAAVGIGAGPVKLDKAAVARAKAKMERKAARAAAERAARAAAVHAEDVKNALGDKELVYTMVLDSPYHAGDPDDEAAAAAAAASGAGPAAAGSDGHKGGSAGSIGQKSGSKDAESGGKPRKSGIFTMLKHKLHSRPNSHEDQKAIADRGSSGAQVDLPASSSHSQSLLNGSGTLGQKIKAMLHVPKKSSTDSKHSNGRASHESK